MPADFNWLSVWNWEPSILLGLAALCGAYGLSIGRLRHRFQNSTSTPPRQIAIFFAGVMIIFFALVSPIDAMGDHYLFSFHMTQHLLLTLVMPPLLLLGTPAWMIEPLLRSRFFYALGRWITSALPALSIFNLLFGFYHLPALYDLSLRNEILHLIVHLALMISAVITWMPICSPTKILPRLPHSAQVLYLFIAAIPPTILGAIITFSDRVLYPTYLAAPRVFGISALEDQQSAGLIMWLPGATIYLIALTIVFFKWFNHSESVEQSNLV
ncbi:MAG: cytochrome c oxidase assembly protein [Chloroflexi bacterium]|nr:cytochrome c oxidase assembly protein [Chloroflexota bacterium]